MSPTLWSLFFESGVLPAGLARRIDESSEMEAVYQKLRGEVDGSFRGSARRAAEDALRQLLEVPLLDVLIPAWEKHPMVQQHLDARRAQPGIVLLDLGEHEITSRHHPRVDIEGTSRVLASLEFVVTLELMLQRARLQLQGDRLVRMTLGACQGNGSLALGTEEIAAFRRREIRLPHEVSFESPIPLTRDAGAPAPTRP